MVAGNVLLNSSCESNHGFQAKISDFGMARDLGTMTKLETTTYGTITHMAPEVLASDYISKVSGFWTQFCLWFMTGCAVTIACFALPAMLSLLAWL